MNVIETNPHRGFTEWEQCISPEGNVPATGKKSKYVTV
jgi:hypothetical protein